MEWPVPLQEEGKQTLPKETAPVASTSFESFKPEDPLAVPRISIPLITGSRTRRFSRGFRPDAAEKLKDATAKK